VAHSTLAVPSYSDSNLAVHFGEVPRANIAQIFHVCAEPWLNFRSPTVSASPGERDFAAYRAVGAIDAAILAVFGSQTRPPSSLQLFVPAAIEQVGGDQ